MVSLDSGAASYMRVLHTPASTLDLDDATDDRRRSSRVAPQHTQWAEAARLRGGLDVRIIDISARGLQIETPTQLHIGARVEVALFASDTKRRLDLTGTVRRCQVVSVCPMNYRGALEFDTDIALSDLEPFLAHKALSA